MTNQEKAIELVSTLRAAGTKFELSDNWLKIEPPPPVSVMMDLMDKKFEAAVIKEIRKTSPT